MQLKLEDNDLVIWGTDGLFDNMFPEDILDVINPSSHQEVSSKLYTNPLTNGVTILFVRNYYLILRQPIE